MNRKLLLNSKLLKLSNNSRWMLKFLPLNKLRLKLKLLLKPRLKQRLKLRLRPKLNQKKLSLN